MASACGPCRRSPMCGRSSTSGRRASSIRRESDCVPDPSALVITETAPPGAPGALGRHDGGAAGSGERPVAVWSAAARAHAAVSHRPGPETDPPSRLGPSRACRAIAVRALPVSMAPTWRSQDSGITTVFHRVYSDRDLRCALKSPAGTTDHQRVGQFDAWRASPGHDRNMRDPRVERVGIGTAADYVTMIACGK
jgi:hypothetical protein